MVKAWKQLLSVFVAALAGVASPLHSARAPFGLYGEEDFTHNGLLWTYGAAFLAIIGFLIYRKRTQGRLTPGQRELRSRIAELERALAVCTTELQNARDYPNECGLTPAEHEERLVSASEIRDKIAEINDQMTLH